jgi:hypothetical protein
MWNRVAIIRFAGLLLAIALLVGMTQHAADEDDLRRGLTPGQTNPPMAIVGDQTPCDQDRIAHQVCSFQPDLHAGYPGNPRSFPFFLTDTNPPAPGRKLYELQAVLLI